MRRAVGIVRKSSGSHEEDTRGAQRERIEQYCADNGLKLVQVHDEKDVSGGTPLLKRKGLRAAIEAVESGEAEFILAAYFDRLVRSLEVQAQLVRRVENAGGTVIALDFGNLTNGTAATTLSAHMLGAVSQYHRDITREKSRDAQQRAIAEGRAPYPAPPGYERGPARKFILNDDADTMRQAFVMRSKGASITQVRDFMKGAGITRSPKAVESLMSSRTYLGQIWHGQHEPNLSAHDAIIDAVTWEKAQRTKGVSGPRPSSDRLLARLKLLRCGTCGGGMTVSSQQQQHKVYPSYRCQAPDCTRRMVIGAEIVEGVVVEAVQEAIAHVEGRASSDEAQDALETAQNELDSLIRKLVDVADEPAAREMLADVKLRRDLARDAVERTAGDFIVKGWRDDLSVAAKRELIVALVERVTIEPGRGRERVRVALHE